tara:strand:- start:14673 stop:15173 length:501 start_codon:yes stop_codon:yes gene_type:complete
MNSGNLPRVPVRFIERNKELLSKSEEKGTTDYKLTEHAEGHLPNVPVQQYRTPHDRVSGNLIFRRYPDGRLDFDYAKHCVLDAIRKAKTGVGLTSQEEAILSVLFPTQFAFVDGGMLAHVRSTLLKVTDDEAALVSKIVRAQMAEELNYNAGFGGSSVPGRSKTIS